MWIAEDVMELKFNIAYVPGTVRYLRLLVFSLLKWSDCSFRLVANACSPQEVRLLRDLCHKSSRLELLAAPSKTVLPYGEMLNYLHSLEHSDYFCFLDSDILATGDFVSEMLPYLGRYAAVFSASPIWCADEPPVVPADLARIPGYINQTAEGLCIGNTCFAIYDNRVLTPFLQTTDVTFQLYQWPDIPGPYQSQLLSMGLKKRAYDNGRVLNILLAARGNRLIFVDSPSLQHIGGFSGRIAKRKRRGLVKRLRRSIRSRQRQSVEARDRLTPVRAKREYKAPTRLYFNELLRSLFEHAPLPPIPELGNRDLEERIESVTANLISLYEEFGEQLA
jgi:hypothetical protein